MSSSSSNMDGDMSSKFSSLNVNAAVFVPSWASPTAPEPTTAANGEPPAHLNGDATNTSKGEPNGIQNGGTESPPDDWDNMEEDQTAKASIAPTDSTDNSADSESPPKRQEVINDTGTSDSSANCETENQSIPTSQSQEVPEDVPPVIKKKTKAVGDEEKARTKEHLNVVFVGHVDAGKSTLGGQIMFLTGEVDKRTLEKYEREAKEQNRESWYLSWALDTNKEEREKGKTVEVGRASFETEAKTFTILDAPGHRSYVPNMIGGAAQADVAILVISARKGEFETGFEKGGQTREHTTLIKTAGVKHVVVAINKMDDSTVNWSKERYQEIVDKLTPFMKKSGFNPKKDIHFIPISGLTGAFIKEIPSENPFPFYEGPSLLNFIDALPKIKRAYGPLRLPVAGKYKDMGVVICGKIESGYIDRLKSDLMMMPLRKEVSVLSIFADKEETDIAYTGENVEVKLKGVEEEEISNGFILCDKSNVCHVCRKFEAQIHIVDYESIICPGFSCIIHCHTAIEEVVFKGFVANIDKKTGQRGTTKPRFVRQDEIVVAVLQASRPICLEMFSQFPQMGRFTLRSNDRTIAMGRVERLASSKSNTEQSSSSEKPSTSN